jgi:hypothetical protein
MGYTHYWKLCNNIIHLGSGHFRFRRATEDDVSQTDKRNFEIAFEACRHIVNEFSHILAGWDGDPESELINTDTEIICNGIDDEAHETFYLNRSLLQNSNMFGQSFCKTARKPYDRVVVLCLWICAKLCRVFEFSSDGGDEVTQADYTDVLESFGIIIYYTDNTYRTIEEIDINGTIYQYNKYDTDEESSSEENEEPIFEEPISEEVEIEMLMKLGDLNIKQNEE